jgi:NADPH:quinone reductase-like Zn-dependent oxidoreductase
MRAAILRAYGAPPEPGDFDEPTAGGGQVVVEVEAAGLNPVDLAGASGAFYRGNPPLPSVPGLEGVGRTPDGQRVYFDGAVQPYGSIAERSLVASGSLIPLLEDLDAGLALALGIAGMAGWLAVDRTGQVQEGETVLVLGASGVLGQVAVQAARLLGAGRVVAAARSEIPDRGADARVTLGGDDLEGRLREAAGGPIDLVIDPLWGAPARAALAALDVGGRLVNVGQSAGAEVAIASLTIRGSARRILGHSNFVTPPEEKRAAYQRMASHAAAGELVVDAERIPLDDVAEAWQRQASSPHHKLVVVPA